MVGFFASYSIENDIRFQRKILEAGKVVTDMSFEFGEISRDWFKSNRAQFSLRGSGQYPPLSPEYAARKRRLGGAPILVGVKPTGGVSGRLRDSVTGSPNSESIVRIGKKSLALGTKVPYGVYHQSDRPRSKMPQRKFLFIGPEAPASAPSEITGRLDRFIRIIDAGLARRLERI